MLVSNGYKGYPYKAGRHLARSRGYSLVVGFTLECGHLEADHWVSRTDRKNMTAQERRASGVWFQADCGNGGAPRAHRGAHGCRRSTRSRKCVIDAVGRDESEHWWKSMDEEIGCVMMHTVFLRDVEAC